MLQRATLLPAVGRCLAHDGAVMIALRADGAVLSDPLRPDVALHAAAGPFSRCAFAGDADHMVLTHAGAVYAWVPPASPIALAVGRTEDPEFGPSARPGELALTARSTTVHVDTVTGITTIWRSCGNAADQAVALTAEGVIYVVCSDRRILRGRVGEVGEPWARLEDRDDARVLGLPGGPGLLVGTTRGSLLHLDAHGVEVSRETLSAEAAYSIAVTPERIAFSTADGVVGVWASSGLSLGRLMAPGAHLAWRGADTLRVVGRASEDRRVPDPSRPHLLTMGAGVSALRLSPDEQTVAVSQGDGTISVLQLADGKVSHTWKWQDGVAKDVAFSPDGRYLATGVARGDDQRIFDLQDGSLVRTFAHRTIRRLGWFQSGWLVAAPYVPGLAGWQTVHAEETTLDPGQFEALEVDAGGTFAVGITEDDGIWRLTDGEPPTLRKLTVLADNRAVAPLGADSLVLLRSEVVRLDETGAERGRIQLPSDGTDIAGSPDGRWFAVGLLTGDILVWRNGQEAPVVRLVGHAARVAGLQFTRDGRWLVSGGWDDAVRVWSLADVDEPGEALRARLETEWGRTLAEVLAGRR